jgi:hypothetical protein
MVKTALENETISESAKMALRTLLEFSVTRLAAAEYLT